MTIIILEEANQFFAQCCELSFKPKLAEHSLAVASRFRKELLLNHYRNHPKPLFVRVVKTDIIMLISMDTSTQLEFFLAVFHYRFYQDSNCAVKTTLLLRAISYLLAVP